MGVVLSNEACGNSLHSNRKQKQNLPRQKTSQIHKIQNKELKKVEAIVLGLMGEFIHTEII